MEGYSVLPFFTECNNYGDIRLVNTTKAYNSDGTTDVTGVVEFCNDGAWNTVCEDGITPYDATQFCRQYGYTSKRIHYNMQNIISLPPSLPPLSSLSLSLPDGTIVTDSSIVLSNPRPYVNLSCPDYDYYRADSCYINSNSGPCDYTVVKCFDGELCISC